MKEIFKGIAVTLAAVLITISLSVAFTVDIKSNEKIGNYLVNEKGMTLYYFENDPPKTSTCFESCATTWPIFHAEWIDIPDGLNRGDLEEIGRVDGIYQTTYKGHPLYLYSGDRNPGETNGEGVNGMWFAMRI
jgi:predicted lipoprotein with Yx(FWY)xxD motif